MPREASLFQALTATDRLIDLLPVLHHHAVSAVEGRSSIIFQFARTGDTLLATSAFGVDHLPPDPWPARLIPEALFRDEKPRFIADISRVVPGAHEYLGTLPAVLVPLAQMQTQMGVLVIGCEKLPSPQQMREAASVGHAFTLALDRAHASGETDLQSELRELLHTSRAMSRRRHCLQDWRCFASARTDSSAPTARRCGCTIDAPACWSCPPLPMSSIWHRIGVSRRPICLAPSAVALRRERAEIAAIGTTPAGAPTATVTVPLKGRRRALGTLVMEEVRLDPGSQIDLLERADEMGRQLAAAVENVLLLDAVLRSRRELENTFNSLVDLVAVSDQDGLLVSMNVAFLERVGMTHQELSIGRLPMLSGLINELILAAMDAAASDPHRRQRPSKSKTRNCEGHSRDVDAARRRRAPIDGIVLVARDVTPQAELEAERADLRNRLVQSEKLAALGQFVAGIAHELNNPLQGVLGHLELLVQRGRFRSRLRRDISGFIARPTGPRRSSATCSFSQDRGGSCGAARASTPRCRACCRCARRRFARPIQGHRRARLRSRA